MDKPISYMMTKSVWTADSEDTVERVEELLSSHRLSSVPVVDSKGVIFGIISASDLVRFHVEHKNPRALRAWEICTYKPIEVGPTALIGDVARLMVKNKIHHVVISENRLIVGIVSSLDFVEQYVLEGAPNPQLLPAGQQHRALSSACRPAAEHDVGLERLPGNHMPFSGLQDATQRADIIDYLKTLR